MAHNKELQNDEYFCYKCGKRWATDEPAPMCVLMSDLFSNVQPPKLDLDHKELAEIYEDALRKIRRMSRENRMSRDILRDVRILADDTLDD